MQINTNTTGMNAELCVSTDKHGRDHCVVVVKGTFDVGPDGQCRLAPEQRPFVFADEFYGEPGKAAIKYECDFAPFKPRCDVLHVGSAHAPDGQPTKHVTVGLAIGPIQKTFEVVGNRVWDSVLLSIAPSEPQPFLKLPIHYSTAWGGADASPKKPDKQDTFRDNPVGVGYYPLSKKIDLVGRPLPNNYENGRPIKSTTGNFRPMALGSIGRNFPTRLAHAGTYDKKWLDEVSPFLPEDFDPRYFQSAPLDQQMDYLQGGEVGKCMNLSPNGEFGFIIPKIDVPITFRFRDRDVKGQPKIDTLIIESDHRQIVLLWRASTPLGRKLNALREIVVGYEKKSRPPMGSRRFKSLAEFIRWKKGSDHTEPKEQGD